jgi:Oxidoreductase molybdopterin binding domain
LASGSRAGRGTNLAILVTLGAALATGTLALAIGVGWGRWVVVAHAVAGLTLVAIAPWKTAIARRGIRRRGPRATTSVILAGLVVAALGTGVAHAAGIGELGPLPVRALWVHIVTALVAVPLALWHVVVRPVRPRRTDLTRRSLLRGGVAVGAGAAAYAVSQGAIRGLDLPGARRRFTGSHEVGSFEPSAMPTTIWLNDRTPAIDLSDHRVEVVTASGSRRLRVEEIAAPEDQVRVTLDCTSGWYATQDWSGTRLDRLLGASGDSILVRSVTGYARRFPARDASRLLLATHVGGDPLDAGHGAPVRLVAPGRRGFWWVKWVDLVAADETPWWWQPPFPLA